MPVYYRTQQSTIQVTMAGILDKDSALSWDKMEGGDNAADTTNYLPGAMQPSVELGGVPKRSDMTVSRIWSPYLIGVYSALDGACGAGQAKISYSNLDVNGSVVPGSTITYTGILKSVARPAYDSSSSAEAVLTLIFGLNGPIVGPTPANVS